ncbi:MAG: rod shape-determining protein MreD [Actinomycetota bacterium]
MIELVNRPFVRLLMVGLPALAVQTTLLAELTPFGIVMQLLLCMSIGAGVSAGPEGGALAGFVLGVMFDFVLTSPLGLSALVYGLAGFVGGFAFSQSLANPRWLNAVTCAGLSAAAVFVQPIIANWIGVEGWISSRLVKVMFVVALFNGAASFVVVPVMRWCLAVRRQQRLAPPAEVYL